MKKVIKVYRDSRLLEIDNLEAYKLGVKNDNKVDTLIFSFDEFVDGMCELLTDIQDKDNNYQFFTLNKDVENKEYTLEVTHELLVKPEIKIQLQITNREERIWHSKIATLKIYDCLEIGQESMPTSIDNWLINADTQLAIYEENEKQRVDNEKVRQENEILRIQREQKRIEDENIRISAEKARDQNEDERVQYYENFKEKVDNGEFNGKDALINGVNALNIEAGTNISLEQENSTLTIANTYDDSQLKADIKKVNDNLNNYSLIAETGSKVALNINSSTYVMKLELKDKNDNVISSDNIDLPLESMVVNATYKDETKEIELTLQNGTKVAFSVSALVSGLINEDDLNNILKDYALKTSIPTKTSQLTNDSGFIDKSVNNLDNYYKKTEIDTKVQTINKTTNELGTRLTTAEKNIETNKIDIKDLSNRTKRIETDIFDSGEASGTGINLQDSTLAEFQEVKIDGIGNQETTNGNQILDFANPTRSSTGLTSVFENDTLEIVGHSGTIYQSVYYNIPLDFLENNKGKTIKFSKKSSKTTNSSADSVVQIISSYNDETPTTYRRIYDFSKDIPLNDYIIPQDLSNLKSVIASFYTNNSSSTEIENNLTIEEPLLYFDNNDTYEPYTGRQPSPSPDYKQPIEVIEEDFDLVSCGKNICPTDASDWEQGTLSVQGENADNTTRIRTIGYYLIQTGLDYYVSIQSNDYTFVNIMLYDSDKNFVEGYYNIDNNILGTRNLKINIPKNYNASYMRVTLQHNGATTITPNEIENIKPMIEQGSTATEYEPYTETRQKITIPEGEFAGKIDDTYKDQFRINYNEQDGKYHLYLDKVIGKVVLNGSENWSDRPTYEYCDRFVASQIFNQNLKSIKNKNDRFIMGQVNYNTYPYLAINVNQIIINFSEKNITSLEQFKQWLSTNNVELYYVLNEPYTLDLGIVNMPLSYYPITNVYNTCVRIPNMYVKYYCDFKKTITTIEIDVEDLKDTIGDIDSIIDNINGEVI